LIVLSTRIFFSMTARFLSYSHCERAWLLSWSVKDLHDHWLSLFHVKSLLNNVFNDSCFWWSSAFSDHVHHSFIQSIVTFSIRWLLSVNVNSWVWYLFIETSSFFLQIQRRSSSILWLSQNWSVEEQHFEQRWFSASEKCFEHYWWVQFTLSVL